nr:immunoglobulin heavy chain junction region [Macaca mulatta]MOW87208.1 immunoglobulin heavy chain junction region [Macaca mulatta]MOW87790.1 immunoglobulin heavy chain junction region [Macaca mulatta]MOW87903.1 immunoglobulin heavy chain junction region [Macaca mulatta]MOW88064.1 immunoglobulin heavy chain junction region [Macaca mulatta]
CARGGGRPAYTATVMFDYW